MQANIKNEETFSSISSCTGKHANATDSSWVNWLYAVKQYDVTNALAAVTTVG